MAALQNGAKLFVNYCLNCHGLSYMRYNRLTELGLTEQQIKDNLMFTADKIGEPMRVAMRVQPSRNSGSALRRRISPDRPRPRFRGRQRRRLAVHLPALVLSRRPSARPAGTTWFSRTSACRTSLATAGRAGPEQGSQARTGCAGHDVAEGIRQGGPIWSASWSGWPSRCRVSASSWAGRAGLPGVLFGFAYALKKNTGKTSNKGHNARSGGIAGEGAQAPVP
jgi:hypothetical protein